MRLVYLTNGSLLWLSSGIAKQLTKVNNYCSMPQEILFEKGMYFNWYMLQEIARMITHLLRIHIFCATKVFNSRFIRRSVKWVYWAAAVNVIQYLIMVKYASTYDSFSRLIYSYLNLFLNQRGISREQSAM